MRTSFRVRSTTPVASPSLMLTGVPSGLVSVATRAAGRMTAVIVLRSLATSAVRMSPPSAAGTGTPGVTGEGSPAVGKARGSPCRP
jgi:hypothetical protein